MSHEIPRSHVASVGVSRDESGEGTISQDGASAGKLQGHSVMLACGCRSDRDGSIPEPVEAMSCPRVIAGKGETLPLLLRLTTRNSGKANCLLSLPFCLLALGICLFPSSLPRTRVQGGNRPLAEWGGGKGEKGARNLKSRFQFFLRFCEV